MSLSSFSLYGLAETRLRLSLLPLTYLHFDLTQQPAHERIQVPQKVTPMMPVVFDSNTPCATKVSFMSSITRYRLARFPRQMHESSNEHS